ncbi:DNA repair protein RecO [Spiroplasma tabanidicola]|uniref:DNA repair protein RecO n=1 Tax=Spiroplasma tabanidicola TaxID=324079 RepID=A0A6I6CAZ2_9MOLU|nr:DNA repair protein RecO [Spiroplasma tabanidicola]QGS52101.1 DNA repair protein recO [Spiroplasma tabanidicola]
MAAIKIEGFVLNSYDYDDYAKVIKVYSKQYGVLSFFAPGVNKEASKNKYSIQTLSYSDFEIFKSRSDNKISKLKTGNLKKEYFNIAKTYVNYVYVSVTISMIEQLSVPGFQNYKIYNAFKTMLENIDNNINVFNNYVLFLLFYIQNSEYKFNLNYCSRCKKRDYPIVRFEYSDKTLVCKRCLWPGEIIQPLSFVNILSNFNKHTFNYLVDQRYNAVDIIVLHNLMLDYLESDLGIFISGSRILKNSASTFISEVNAIQYK